MTGVDKLHQEGHFGKGIKIGIIDTGVDYTHPALGGSFGPGNKVIGGYDFVGDNYTGRLGPPPAPDNDVSYASSRFALLSSVVDHS
jgi:subtilisin family serine protease